MRDNLSEIFDTNKFSEYSGTYEVFKDVTLNGTKIDFLFLDKNKGAVLLNIITDENQRDNKIFSLQICKSHLYLPPIISKFVTLFAFYDKKIELSQENINKSEVKIFTLKEEIDIEKKITKIILKDNELSQYSIMTNVLYQKIKDIFIYEKKECNFSISLSKDQLSIIKDNVIRRRVAGSAGSGKSLIVALKAARSLYQGKSVLITSFNITMMNYIRDLVYVGLNKPSLYENKFNQKNINDIDITKLRTIHFHGILSVIRSKSSKKGVTSTNLLDPNLLSELLDFLKKNPSIHDEIKADCIIIDEGQDFNLEWLLFLQELLHKDGQLLLMADATQDLYSKAYNLVDKKLTGMNFKGGWKRLSHSYRLPSNVATVSKLFAEEFISLDAQTKELTVLPEKQQREIDLFERPIKWYQCNLPETNDQESLNNHEILMIEIIKQEITLLMNTFCKSYGDICLLCSSKVFGSRIVSELNNIYIPTETVYSENKTINRIEKLNLGSHPSYLKCSTIHSYKGWESKAIILVNVRKRTYDTEINSEFNNIKIDFRPITKTGHSAFYVGLTRVSHTPDGCELIIINEIPEYETFGKYLSEEKQYIQFEKLEYAKQNKTANIILHSEI